MKCRHQERVKRTVTRSPVLDEKIEEYQPHWSSPEIAQKLSQGARREQVSIGSKQYPIDVIDIPGEVTAYPADPVPVVWFPGFASTSLTFASNMARMSERGRRTISVYCPHGVTVPK